MKIVKVVGREIFNSNGFPALECELQLEDGALIVASVPKGTSVGHFEVSDMRDGGTRLMGQGLLHAIESLEQKVAPVLLGQEPNIVDCDQRMLELDETPEKSIIGGNVLLAASSAICRAQAYCEQIEPYELIAHLCGLDSVTLPFPMFNLINGGAHAQDNLRIQEFMVVPVGERSFRASYEAGINFSYTLGELLKNRGIPIIVGMEGGYCLNVENEEQVLDLLVETMNMLESQSTGAFAIALDVAASQFYNAGTGIYDWKGEACTSQDLINYYEQLCAQYPIYSIEDGLSEYDWEGWFVLNARLGDKIQIVGDDLFATNPARIKYGIEKGAANAAIIKPTQIGTITQTLQAIALCKHNNLGFILSHRSQETEDVLLIDLAVGTNAGQIKAGGLLRGERIMKYNELVRIEDRLTHGMLSRE